MDLQLTDGGYTVIGASQGVGLETVRFLLEDGCCVVAASRNASKSADLLNLAASADDRLFICDTDVTDPSAIVELVEQSLKRFGSITGLALCNHWMGQSRSFAATDDAEWDEAFQNSLMAAVRTVRAFAPVMNAGNQHRAERGSIVLTTAYSARAPKPAIPAYAVFKAALENLVKGLAKTYGPSGIRVNAVAPGAMRTGRYKNRLARLRKSDPAISMADAEAAMMADIGMSPALNRIGDPAEIAALIVFLLSPRSSYTTGLIANVDGGTDF